MYREEHAYKRFQRDFKSGELKPVLLLYGKEQFLVEWAKNLVVNKYIQPASKVLDYTVIDEDDIETGNATNIAGIIGRIIEASETMPLLSEKKVVIAKAGKLLNTSSSKSSNNSANSELDRICNYISNIPESTILIFVSDSSAPASAGSVDMKKKLPKAIQKNGAVYNFDELDRKELISFADKRFRAGNVNISGSVMNRLIDKTGYFNKESDYDLYTFSNDIVKLIALADGGEVTEAMVNSAVEQDIETFIFSLMNSISDGRRDRAFSLLHNIQSDKSDASGLTAMIVSQFEIMYSAKELIESRVPDRVITEKLGIKEARLRMLRPYINKYSLSKLRDCLNYAYEIDRNIKTGLLRPSLALEMFVAKL